jgi:hypothetical protein
MLNKRRDAAIKVARELFALEKAIDGALAQAAELNAVMPTAWGEANISAVVGQEAFEGAAAVLAALVRARRHVVDTHHKLNDTKNRIGLRTVNFGGADKGTKDDPKGAYGLALVASDESRAA